jgi:hypothetical protein
MRQFLLGQRNCFVIPPICPRSEPISRRHAATFQEARSPRFERRHGAKPRRNLTGQRIVTLSRAAPATSKAQTASACPPCWGRHVEKSLVSERARYDTGASSLSFKSGDDLPDQPYRTCGGLAVRFGTARRGQGRISGFAIAAPPVRDPVGLTSGRVRRNNERVSGGLLRTFISLRTIAGEAGRPMSISFPPSRATALRNYRTQ